MSVILSLAPKMKLQQVFVKCLCSCRYEIMLLCWNYCPHDRPDFVALVQRLDAMVSESVGMVKIAF